MVNPDDDNPRDDSRGYAWIKIRTSLIDDPKFMQLTDQAKATYFELYLLAGKSDAFGMVLIGDDSATVQDIAWTLRVQDADLQKSLDALQRVGLIDLDDGVTIAKFAREQGPAMADQRKAWKKRQSKRRALAKGETWTDPDAETEPDPEKEKDPVAEKEKESEQEKIKNQTKTKRVTQTSRESHARVTRDNGGGGNLDEYANTILSIWHAKTGKKFTKNAAFLDMCQNWIDGKVTVGHVTKAIDQAMQNPVKPNTPMYLSDIAVNVKDADPEKQKAKSLDQWRGLWSQNHGPDDADPDIEVDNGTR